MNGEEDHCCKTDECDWPDCKNPCACREWIDD